MTTRTKIMELVRGAINAARDHEIACCDPNVPDDVRRAAEVRANEAYDRLEKAVRVVTS